jgi:drug/metabolite transporter (DMT)-like permease
LRSQLKPAQIALVGVGSLILVSGLALASTGIGGSLLIAGLLCWAASVLASRSLQSSILGLSVGVLSFVLLTVVLVAASMLVQRAADENSSSGKVVTPSAGPR